MQLLDREIVFEEFLGDEEDGAAGSAARGGGGGGGSGTPGKRDRRRGLGSTADVIRAALRGQKGRQGRHAGGGHVTGGSLFDAATASFEVGLSELCLTHAAAWAAWAWPRHP